jgi:FkbM family methyltransferase
MRPVQLSKRIIAAATTRFRALQLGCSFVRTSDFRLPNEIKLNGRRIETRFPNEIGVETAFLELLLSDCYGLRTVKGPVRKVLDIGANVGIFAIAARQRFPLAEIHCYEPNRGLEPHLNVQLRATGAKILWEAVALEDGQVSLDVQADSVNTTSHADVGGHVPATAFRKVVERLGNEVDVAKVDCEGAEWEFLTDHAPWQHVRYLAMEYHLHKPEHTHGAAAELVRQRGFTIRRQVKAETFGLLIATRT